MQLNDHREKNPWTKLCETSGSGRLRGWESTLEKYHSRLTLLFCSSLGSALFAPLEAGCLVSWSTAPTRYSHSRSSTVHEQWVGLKSRLVLPSLIYPFQLTDPKWLQAVLPKVSLSRFREPYGEYHGFSLGLIKLPDVGPWGDTSLEEMSFASLEKCTAMWPCLLMLTINASEPSPSGGWTLLPAIVPISCKTELSQLVAAPNTDSAIFLNCLRTGVLQSNRPILATAALQKATRLALHAATTCSAKYAQNVCKSAARRL